jgi:4-hydroxybenzoate polyprenyltransferase
MAHFLQSTFDRIGQHRSTLLLGYLALTGVFSMMSVEAYLGSNLPLGLALATVGMIFGIYLLNVFTDVEEDFTNDISRRIVLDKRPLYLALLGLCLGGTFAMLATLNKLHAFHLAVVALGAAYSFHVVPWRSQAGTWTFRRLKDITLVKNLVVASLWGAFMVVMPLLYSGRPLAESQMLFFLGGGFFLAAFCNTLFADILDLAGDTVAGVPTLPVKYGTRFSFAIIGSLAVSWLGIIYFAYTQNWMDGYHLGVLAIPALYPLTYLYSHYRFPDRKFLTHVLMETDLVIFAAGTWLLRG